ncbi:MAG: HAMP domain-containing histidine kinase [Planctomycetes bacterium]|nr:HAMP domain-containing histidine kinase [Planctomycetota bacterium]
MALRTKIFLAIMITMLIVAGIMSIKVVFETMSVYQKTAGTYRQSLTKVVNNWVYTNIPKEVDKESLIKVIEQYERMLVENPESALFSSITIVDKYRRILHQAAQTNYPKFQRLYEESLEKALEGDMQVMGMQIYKPLYQVKSIIPRYIPEALKKRFKENLAEIDNELPPEWVIILNLNLPLTSRINLIQVIMPVFWIMGLGTVLLILVIYILLSKLVLAPLEKLSAASKKIAKGDYDIKLDIPQKSDEISELVSAFHGMTQEVQNYQFNLVDRVDEAVKKQRKAEQGLIIAQKLAATGTLAAGIAHEINNPLSGMQNAVRRIIKKMPKNSDDSLPEYLNLISDGLYRIQQIVSQVLQYAKRNVNPPPFSMQEPVEKSIAFLDHKARRLEVKLKIIPPEHEISLCFGDRGEFQQVITNLVINSIDAIRTAMNKVLQGQKRLSNENIVTINWDETEDGIEVKVEDTGCGMTEEEINRAFDAFYTMREEGTGLGLTIIHNIIESHGGTINIESVPMKGSIVTFTVPKQLED